MIFFFLFKIRQCFVTKEKVENWYNLEQFFFSLIKPFIFLFYYLENQAIRNYWQKTNPGIESSVKGTAEKIQCKLTNEYLRIFLFHSNVVDKAV